jgi:hypothetical protein
MAKTTKDQSMNKLLNFFGLALKDKNIAGHANIVVPGKPKTKDDSSSPATPINFPSDINKALEYFMANYDMSSNAERFNRYQSLLFMCRSSGIMGSAAQIYSEESWEAKDGVRPIQIKSKDRKVEKLFYSWLDSIGFNNNILRELAWNLTVFGDAFWINSIDMGKGIIGVSVLDPFLVKDKLEFSLNTLGQTRNWQGSVNTLTSRYEILKSIASMIDGENTDEDYSLYYQSYLLGYEIRTSVAQDSDVKALPPWAITHFRHFSTSSEFFPFGRPLFINSLARYKSYMTTEMLIDMLRVASFPKEKITIKGGETLSPLDRRIKLNEVKQMIENMCPRTNAKDNISIGDRIYDMDDLYEYDVIDPGVDIDNLGDLEMKLDDLILTTGIPDSYLIPSRGSGMGGENASALFYNNKIFQRRVVGNKSALLEGLTHTFRMHLELISDFDGAETEFELFMPVNADMYSDDKASFEGDMLKLATEMLEGLGQALGLERGESLPEPVVRDILKHYLPIDDEVLDKWINKIVKKHEIDEIEQAKEGDVPKEPEPAPFSMKAKEKIEVKNEAMRRFIESYDRGDEDSTLRQLYFATKNRLGLTNGLYDNKLFYNNTHKIREDKTKPGYDRSIYSLLNKQKIDRKLKEQK